MPWRGHAGTVCKRCHRPVEECGPLSARYRCAACGEEAMTGNHRQLVAHSGPWFLHWRRRTAEAVGAVLLEDVERDG